MSDVVASPANILLVEDNPGDVQLVMESLRSSSYLNSLSVVADGEAALAFLRRRGQYASAPRAHLILLDLNLPLKNGHEVLAEIKADPELKRIPVIIITSSSGEEDMRRAYNNNANCYLTKPLDLHDFVNVIRSIEAFWLNFVKLPRE